MVKDAAVCFLSFLLPVILFTSCKKADDFLTDSSARLSFSQDTVLFDTVFVRTGSATQVFTVRNPNDKPVRLSAVKLANGAGSYFRLNVNGTPGNTIPDVEIGANDSIYIFAEVTIPDPLNPNTPFIVSDQILFELNGSTQQVALIAWGQRAYFHHAPPNSGSLFFLNCNEQWTNDLPHVIYGYALVDSGCTLTMMQGTRVYCHPNSGIIVLSDATLKIDGTLQMPVIMQGDRLDYGYHDVPGQWSGIHLSNITHSRLVNGTHEVGPGTINSTINYAIIKNGDIGLQVDTVFAPGEVALTLDNTIIENMSGVALLAQGTSIKSDNCVFANCGQYLAALLYGGNYRFLHCTFANFWSQSDRQTPSVFINNYNAADGSIRPIDSAYFGNCIVYGNIDTELGFDSAYVAPNGVFNFLFDHSLIKVGSDFSTSSSAHYKSIINGYDPLFNDPDNNDYELGTTSIAINAGDSGILNLAPAVLATDLKGNTRPQGSAPDPGAYEKR